jgi:hypothetical protein
MQKSNFRDWTLDKIDDAFGTTQVDELPILNELLNFEYQVDDFETRYLSMLSKDYLNLGGDNWNEVELENKIISPTIVFSGIQNKKFSYFLERDLSTTIDEFDLSGRVDGMIATGFRSPKVPYFCLNEYKRQTDPDGDPQGQALIAMLVAQKLNDNNNRNADRPIYGSYIIGRNWYFMALVGKEYAISKDYSCVDDEMFDIFRILKSLRVQIEKII